MSRVRILSLAGCLIVAAIARIVALNFFAGVEGLYGDERYYVQTALSIATGEGHPGSVRPPLYAAFLAGIYELFGRQLDVARAAQVVVGLLTVALVHGIAAARRGTATATAAGLACALSPMLVHYAHFLWSETLLAALVVAFFAAADAYDRRDSLMWLAAAGLALGLCALTRETWAHFAVLAAVWVAWPLRATPRAALGRAGLLLGTTALVIAPWTIRNQDVHGSFVLVSTNRWFPIAAGNVWPEGEWLLGRADMLSYRRRVKKRDPELVQEEYWKEVALAAISKQQPAWAFKKVPRTVCGLVSPLTQPVRFLKQGWLPHPGAGAAAGLVSSDAVGNALVLLLGVIGLWLTPFGRTSGLAAAAILFTFAVHTVANSVPRFLVPLTPLLALHAGAVLARAWDGDGRGRRGRWIAAGVTCALLVVAIAIQWDTTVTAAVDLAGPRGRESGE